MRSNEVEITSKIIAFVTRRISISGKKKTAGKKKGKKRM